MAIDLQVHFWEQHSKERPHLNIAIPNLPYPFGPDEMLPLMKDAGVEHVVIVPPGFMGDNNIYALQCVKKYIMSKIVSFSNQKGGVGKTTTSVNLAVSFAVSYVKTLLIDLDPQ